MSSADTSRGISPKELSDQLANIGTSISGVATGGTNNTLDDTTNDREVDLIAGATIKITHAGISYYRIITGNTANTITFNALPVGISVVAGDAYQVPSNPKASSPVKVSGNAIGNWNSGVAPSGLQGALVLAIPLTASQIVEYRNITCLITALTPAATITFRILQEFAAGVLTPVYSETFIQGTDPDGCMIINGNIDFGYPLSIEAASDQAADDGLGIEYFTTGMLL
jgi:hypothetical protein